MNKLELQNVCYDYLSGAKAVHAVKNVSAAFESGKFYAVVGRSGSGKTTMLSLLAGLDSPTSGKVLFEGRDLSSLDAASNRLQNVSFIYQNYNLLPFLTAAENIELPLKLRGEKNLGGKAEQMLHAVGLDKKYCRRFPSAMSGGEQQRVAIARALAMGTGLILADEPTGNLDSENADNIVSIFASLAHERGYCVVVVTHDREIAEKADEVLRMRDGEVTE